MGGAYGGHHPDTVPPDCVVAPVGRYGRGGWLLWWDVDDEEKPVADGEELLSLSDAADRLGVHYMTAYRYVRTGRLPASKQGGTWVVSAADLETFAAGAGATVSGADHSPEAQPRRTAVRSTYASRLEDRLVRGDERGAWGVVEEALTSSLTPDEVYTDVMAPAMASIGERWARHELDIEDEHMASTIVHRLAGRLGPRFARRGRHRGTVVVGAPAGDAHGLPVMLMADLLRGRGFDVVDLGADTPPTAFARAAANADRLVAVGICATSAGNDEAVGEAAAAIAAATGAVVVLGGQGVDEATETVVTERLVQVAPGAHLVRTHGTEDALASFERVASPST